MLLDQAGRHSEQELQCDYCEELTLLQQAGRHSEQKELLPSCCEDWMLLQQADTPKQELLPSCYEERPQCKLESSASVCSDIPGRWDSAQNLCVCV